MNDSITDEEFDLFFKNLTGNDILEHLGKMVGSIKIRGSGAAYTCYNVDDVKAVVEQELYQKMTGRE